MFRIRMAGLLVLLVGGTLVCGLVPAVAGEDDSGNPQQISAPTEDDYDEASIERGNTTDSHAAEAGDEDYDDDNLDFLEEEASDASMVTVADPLAPWNRAMFHFNDKLYFWVLKPVCQGYNYVLPTAARTGMKHFFINAAAPIRLINCLLQGKVLEAEGEWSRFLMNSTVGVLGFGNPAETIPDLRLNDEDLGQSLGVFGIGDGCYIVWPIIGPSTLRDSIGEIGDGFLNPRFYLQPFMLSAGLWTLEKVNDTSFRIGDYETLKDAAIEPYEALRDAYIQLRMKKMAE